MAKLINQNILLTQTRQPTARELSVWNRQGHVVHYQALLNVNYLPVEPLTITPQAIVLTSANSALALQYSDWDRTIPVYGVGTTTATTAKSIGFLDCSSPSDKPYPSALNLISWIKKNLAPADGPLIFGCGNYIRHDVSDALKPFGFTSLKVVLYTTEPAVAFDKKIELALKNHEIHAVMINSEQALVTFMTLCNKAAIPFNDFTILLPSQFLKTIARQLGYANISIFQRKQ